jgi:hypothetical protein
VVKSNRLLENLEDIQYDYAGKYNDPGVIFQMVKYWTYGCNNAIEDAKTDDDIEGIILNGTQLEWHSARLRDVLGRFQKTSVYYLFKCLLLKRILLELVAG